MNPLSQTPFSLLDLSPIRQGGSAAESFRNSLDLARHAERWGYSRFWVAEHHNLPGVASAATAVVIGHIAGGTSTIRVGAGGIMLPNHAPLVIAEQFGTLESLYPGRIDLGLGRAPGGDHSAARALRRHLAGGGGADTFPRDVLELMSYFARSEPGQSVRAVPGEGLDVPIWLLGSSDFSATLAAELGLPFAFASHFAPEMLLAALELYRATFKPSQRTPEPRVMVAVNVVAADTDAQARRLFTSLQQQFLNMVRGTPAQLPPPVDTLEGRWTPTEKAWIEQRIRVSAVGSPDTVRRKLTEILETTRADELILTAHIYDHATRLRSFELAAQAMGAPRSKLRQGAPRGTRGCLSAASISEEFRSAEASPTRRASPTANRTEESAARMRWNCVLHTPTLRAQHSIVRLAVGLARRVGDASSRTEVLRERKPFQASARNHRDCEIFLTR